MDLVPVVFQKLDDSKTGVILTPKISGPFW
jgi:hypothetical protein